ncbi:hypothetical protein PCANC_12806 [Puccinia coronata f. sp. avenae]|uniref:Pre-rRNA-processing protein RIX1 n=1 Tax=Puccinia coronata f. sp. avenae TaxID=200324 RepID=A0A2N5T4G0_9BASI|nr:hypothetical protein PCANC_12806 [Puccinia coronata f. sp. avenae]
MEYLLSTLLSTAEHPATHQQADDICAAFEHCSHSTKDQPDILPRWFNRIHSLLASKNQIHSALGARLARLTLQKDPYCITTQGARWILACQNYISRHPQQFDHVCLAHSIQLILIIFEWSSRWSDFAREHCDPKATITLARALIEIAQDHTAQDNKEVPALALRTLATLITRNASILRPLASQLQSLALTNLLSPDRLSHGATSLLTQLYRLSGKTDASSSWSKTIKATIGTIDILLDALLSPFLKESDLNPPRDAPLAPLEIPAQELVYSPHPTSSSSSSTREENTHLASYRIPLLLGRTERLIHVLITMLSQPTERPVCIPLGELCFLVRRLLLLGKAHTHERADQAWKLAWDALGATVTLRLLGCRLVARLAECATSRLTPFASQLLTILASEIETNRNPVGGQQTRDVSVMYGTYARVVARCACNPEVLKTTLEPVLKTLLHDLQPIYGSAAPCATSSPPPPDPASSKQPKKSRKKIARYACDPAWNLAVVVDPLDLCVAERALDTLEILFGAIPYGFPTPYLTLCVREVLGLAGHPSFITGGSKQASTTSGKGGVLSRGAQGRSPGVAYAVRPSLRAKVLGCLVRCVPIQRLASQPLMGLGLAQSLAGILQALVAAQHGADAHLADLARQGQAALSLLARPRVPPVFPAAVHANLELDAEPVVESSDDDADTNDDEDLADAPPAPQHRAFSPTRHQPTHLAPPPAAATVPVAPLQPLAAAPVQPWKSSLSMLYSQDVDPSEAAAAGSAGRKRKPLDDDPDPLLRPPKKNSGLRPLTVEPDSSDDDEGDAEDGFVKLPQLTFDDDDDDEQEGEGGGGGGGSGLDEEEERGAE